MTSSIQQVAGDYAIQVGQIGQVETLSFDLSQQVNNSGTLQIQIGSIVGGVVNINHTGNDFPPKLRPLPVQLGPRPFPLLLGRREEIHCALETLANHQPIEFHGDVGIGKTVLLRHLAHHPSIPSAFPGGIVYHHAVRYESVSDLLQILFDAFYESSIPIKPTDVQIREALKDQKALILLDEVTHQREDLQDLLNAVPGFTFLFAAPEQQLWGEGRVTALRGLALEDALALVAQEFGRNLSPEELRAAEILCTQLQGHPLKILQAVALAREEKRSLVAIAPQLKAMTAAKDFAAYLLSSLQKPHQIIVSLLTALGINVALGSERIAELTRIPDAKAILESLLRRNLVQAEGDRYTLANSLTETLRQEWDLTPWMERLSTYFQTWTQHQTSPERLLAESDVILHLLDWAISLGRWPDVFSLARMIEGPLALSGRWDEWAKVLRYLLEAARVTGDRAIQAFVLHQLGTRALCLSDTMTARDLLHQALELRESLGDTVGAAATRHNLELLSVPVPSESSETSPPAELTANRHILLKVAAAALLLGAIGGGLWLVNSTPTPTPTPTPTTPVPTDSLPPTVSPSPGTLEFSTDTLSFGNLVIGEPGKKQTVTLTNRSEGSLTIQDVTLTGMRQNEFAITAIPKGCSQGTVLSSQGDSCQIQVALTPKQAGERRAALKIVHTGAASPKQITLLGQGVQPLQIVTFSADPQEIQSGQKAALCYSVSGATSATITPGIDAVTVPKGCQSVSPEQTTTYTLTATGQGRTSQTKTVTVKVRAPEKPVRILNFTATSGVRNSFQLCYGTTNAVSATITPEVGDLKPVDQGCVTVSPQQSTAYTLTAIGRNGQKDSKQVQVNLYIPKILSFYQKIEQSLCNTGKQVTSGCLSPAQLCYSTVNAVSVVINPPPLRAITNPSEGCVPMSSVDGKWTITATSQDGRSTSQTLKKP